MGLMVSLGSELIRFNPANGHIEYSTSKGAIWIVRYGGSTIGRVRSLIIYGSELILCSDKGVFYSTSKGAIWVLRSSTYKNFVDLQDNGREILAMTDDGHLYYSTSKGAVWVRRR